MVTKKSRKETRADASPSATLVPARALCYNESLLEVPMSFKNILIVYLLAFAVFFLIDMVWLGLVARDFYRRHLGGMLSDKVNWPAAILFYLLFIAGLLLFVIVPAQGHALQALWKGAVFGLIAYATYDLTNLATLRDWPLAVTLVDLAWGAVLGGAVCLISTILGRGLVRG
jgi:uncharacterized membrane protein